MRKLQQVPAGVVPAAADPAGPAVLAALTLSNGLTLPRGLAGYHSALPYAAYDKDPALRFSVLDRISVSPLYLWSSLFADADDDSTAKTLGRVFHTITLQPELLEQTTLIVDASTRNTNIYKAAAVTATGKDVILRHEYDVLCRMRDRFHANSLNRSILQGAEREASLFWIDPTTGMPCKARLDVKGKGVVIDVKTTRDLSRFQYDAKDYGYYRQGGWYTSGVEAVTGEKVESFLLIAVEKSAPFDSKVFEIGGKALRAARAQNAINLASYATCKSTGIWPGFPEVIEELAP